MPRVLMNRFLVVFLSFMLLVMPLRAFVPSSQSTVLTNTTVLTTTTKLGLTTIPGWTLVQNNIQTACSAGTTCAFAACTGGGGTECIAPTVAGSVWIVSVMGPTNVTIASVSGSGWQLCPSSNCHAFSATQTSNTDMAYNLTGSAGTQTFTVTVSPTSSAFVMMFAEALPPKNFTASFDAGGTSVQDSCTTSCTGVALTLTGTDFVYQCCGYSSGGNITTGGNAWSSPYLDSVVGNGIGLNVNSGTAPTMSQISGSGTGMVFSAIAFKSSAGTFVPSDSSNFSLVQYQLPTNTGTTTPHAVQVSCSPGCSALTAFAATGAGNLLFLVEGDTGASGFRLSSITDNKSETWIIPTGAGTCGANAGLSCAYVLSSTSGVTSITPTLTGTATSTASFSLWEFHRSIGTWSLDAQGGKSQTSTTLPVSPTITCTGGNDVVITAVAGNGGVSGATYMTVGHFPSAALNLVSLSPFDPSNGALMNTMNCGPFTFPFENGGSNTSNSFTVAFQ